MRWGALARGEHGSQLPTAAAFEQVVLPQLDAAHNLARWLLRDAGLAEDVVQDSVVRALSYFGSYRGGDGRAWFLRIVRNVAYGALSARSPERMSVPLGGDEDAMEAAVERLADDADDPEQALARRERLERLEEALAAVPTVLRECLVLRELEELSYQEIGRVVGVPVGTVMSRLFRARQALMRWQAGEPER
jgi:RNA polymerase sigma-70 factor (ECF subfamily)